MSCIQEIRSPFESLYYQPSPAHCCHDGESMTVVLPTPLAVPAMKSLRLRALRASRAFQRERKSGDHEKHVVRDSSDTLIDLPNQIAKTPSRRVLRNYAASNFVRNQNDRTGNGV